MASPILLPSNVSRFFFFEIVDPFQLVSFVIGAWAEYAIEWASVCRWPSKLL